MHGKRVSQRHGYNKYAEITGRATPALSPTVGSSRLGFEEIARDAAIREIVILVVSLACGLDRFDVRLM